MGQEAVPMDGLAVPQEPGIHETATQQPQSCHDPKHALIQSLKTKLWCATVAEHPTAVQQAMPVNELRQVLAKAASAFKSEPTMLELSVQEPCQVIVVGDTHGQYHDVCHMLDTFGYPSQDRLYVFNGDYVDRGSWGFEVLMLLLHLKLEYPDRCYMLRGNHESTTCTTWYGFKAELIAKWGKEASGIYASFKKLFALLPLAALVNNKTIILHGGLFRDIPPPVKPAAGKAAGAGRKKRKRTGAGGAPPDGPLRVGNLNTLRAASKGGTDPDGLGSTVVAADVLWSDPGPAPGLQENDARGVGLVFGPDITQAFLEETGLKLVIRSHEGPDARDKRGDLPQVLEGWSLDHNTPAGQLITLFSAPDYPQFMAPEEERYNNKGAVAVLSGPTWCEPALKSFEAVKPRPKAIAFYDYLIYAETDEDPAGSCQEDGEELAEAEGDGKEAGCAESIAVAATTQVAVEPVVEVVERVVTGSHGVPSQPPDVQMTNGDVKVGGEEAAAAQPQQVEPSRVRGDDGVAGQVEAQPGQEEGKQCVASKGPEHHVQDDVAKSAVDGLSTAVPAGDAAGTSGDAGTLDTVQLQAVSVTPV